MHGIDMRRIIRIVIRIVADGVLAYSGAAGCRHSAEYAFGYSALPSWPFVQRKRTVVARGVAMIRVHGPTISPAMAK